MNITTIDDLTKYMDDLVKDDEEGGIISNYEFALRRVEADRINPPRFPRRPLTDMDKLELQEQLNILNNIDPTLLRDVNILTRVNEFKDNLIRLISIQNTGGKKSKKSIKRKSKKSKKKSKKSTKRKSRRY